MTTATIQATSKEAAIRLVVLLGIVSLFADATYEGARSVTGPYLALLGASGTIVGIVAGFGELIGYALRLLSGFITDKTRRYWTITIVGYGVNLIAVPLLALAACWEIAAALMIAERIGKAIRTPARDAMLSHATHEIGRGRGFGLHEAMDQIGAVLGPVIVATVLYFRGTYQASFAVLLVPALLALSVLVAARVLYPRPQDLEPTAPELRSAGFSRAYWVYLTAVALIAAGYVDFPLIAFHFQKSSIISPAWIPLLYAVAMGVDAVAALIFGRLFDRKGVSAVVIVAVLSAFFAPLVFWGGLSMAVVGMTLWGIGMGAQESIMRAAVAAMVPPERRGSAYGILNTGYGVAWFLGSALMGYLYDTSPPTLIAFSVGIQLLSVPFLLRSRLPSTVKPA